MRLRFVTLCTVLGACALLAVPGLAGAAPKHNRGLTIAVTENPIDAGDPVVIYGQLKGSDVVNQTIVLYHHINGSHSGFSVVARTTTGPGGYYVFNRADGVVETNRQWFVRLAGTPSVHSRTVYEQVRPLITIAASAATGDTRHALVFSGHVTPNHAGDRVLLQEQRNGDDWRTIGSDRLGPGSNYSISHRWSAPGVHELRVVLPRDARNLEGYSDTVEVTIQQNQNPSFTITAASPSVSYGSSDEISGTLYAKGSTTAGEPNTAIVLCAGSSPSSEVCGVAGATGADGSYSFTVSPTRNAWYSVRTALAPKRRTANLFIGVLDVITLMASGPNQVGTPDTFSGAVLPNKAGEIVLLQRRGADGDFHDIGFGRVKADGTYSINHTFGDPGPKTIRARILSDGTNEGAASSPVTVTVTEPPVASLTPAT